MARMGRTTRWITTGTVAALLLATPAARQAEQAEMLLQAALTRERVEGRPAEALPMYERVIATTGASPRVVAQARIQAAGIQAQSHRLEEARRLLEQVVRTYPDGGVLASEAAARLALMPAPDTQTGLSFTERAVFEGWGPRDVTEDERFVTGNDRGRPSLYVHDNVTDVTTTIWTSTVNGFLRSAMFSPDARQIAFEWQGLGANAPISVMVVNAEPGATPRPLLSPDRDRARPRGWTPDGRSVLAHIQFQDRSSAMAWVPVDGGPERPIREFEPWRQVLTGGRALSPNGALIAYVAVPVEGSSDRYIYVCGANGENERVLVSQAGVNVNPVWLPDSSGLVFLKTREGTSDLMFSRVPPPGEAPAEPMMVKRAFESFPPGTGSGLIRISQTGALHYTRQHDLSRQTVIVDRATPQTVEQAFVGDHASWSPDGSRVAFFRTPPEGNELVVRNLASGEEQAYPRDGLNPMPPRWFSDGSRLVVRVNAVGDGGAPGSGGAFYVVDLNAKVFTRLFARRTETRERSSAVLSPDNRTLYMVARPLSGGPWTEIVAVDVESRDERPVFTFPAGGLPGGAPGLALSPDGSTLAIQAFADDSENFGRLLAVGTDGTGYRELVPRFTSRITWDQARWTPDGLSILFIAADYTGPHPEGGWRLKSVSAFGGAASLDGLDSLALTTPPGVPRLGPNSVSSLDVSPDGARVMFSASPYVAHSLFAVENLVNHVRR